MANSIWLSCSSLLQKSQSWVLCNILQSVFRSEKSWKSTQRRIRRKLETLHYGKTASNCVVKFYAWSFWGCPCIAMCSLKQSRQVCCWCTKGALARHKRDRCWFDRPDPYLLVRLWTIFQGSQESPWIETGLDIWAARADWYSTAS